MTDIKQLPRFSTRRALAGVSAAEYAMLIGLVGVLSIFSLKSLGGSTHDLLADTGTKLETQGTLSLLKTPAGGNSSTAGKSAYKMMTDPATGKISFQVAGGLQGVATNTTSLDGDQLNTLGTAMIANKLTQLAEAETDPALKDYYDKLARASFYLGAAEGELDDVPGLALSWKVPYTNADALRDVITLNRQMSNLMNNPPPNFDAAAFNEVMPLAAEVYNIAQTYQNSLSEYISPDGITTKSFMLTEDSPSAFSGSGEPGSVLTSRNIVPGDPETAFVSYTSLVPYEQLKNVSEQLLVNKKVASVPVESTLTNATTIDEAATADPKVLNP